LTSCFPQKIYHLISPPFIVKSNIKNQKAKRQIKMQNYPLTPTTETKKIFVLFVLLVVSLFFLFILNFDLSFFILIFNFCILAALPR